MAWSLRKLPTLSDRQFAQWSTLLEERTGIHLVRQQRTLLESQVSIRMRELGLDDYDRYYVEVTHGVSGMMEWSTLVDRIAVKETSFFRHRPSLEYVRRYLQNKINNQQLPGSFDVWSIGCATGEEAYSLAMVINDCFELAALNPYYGITAVDISTTALTKARGITPRANSKKSNPKKSNVTCNTAMTAAMKSSANCGSAFVSPKAISFAPTACRTSRWMSSFVKIYWFIFAAGYGGIS